MAFFISNGEGETSLRVGSKALIFKGMLAHQRSILNVGILSQSGKELASDSCHSEGTKR